MPRASSSGRGGWTRSTGRATLKSRRIKAWRKSAPSGSRNSAANTAWVRPCRGRSAARSVLPLPQRNLRGVPAIGRGKMTSDEQRIEPARLICHNGWRRVSAGRCRRKRCGRLCDDVELWSALRSRGFRRPPGRRDDPAVSRGRHVARPVYHPSGDDGGARRANQLSGRYGRARREHARRRLARVARRAWGRASQRRGVGQPLADLCFREQFPGHAMDGRRPRGARVPSVQLRGGGRDRDPLAHLADVANVGEHLYERGRADFFGAPFRLGGTSHFGQRPALSWPNWSRCWKSFSPAGTRRRVADRRRDPGMQCLGYRKLTTGRSLPRRNKDRLASQAPLREWRGPFSGRRIQLGGKLPSFAWTTSADRDRT